MKIVVLTGAGISAESGIKTFRDAKGLWENHRLEDVATPQGFQKNPELVHQFYNQRRKQLKEVKPNAGHLALVELEKRVGPENFLLITQNVDDLHEHAGSKRLLHMHGELAKISCSSCHEKLSWREDLSIEHSCPACKTVGQLRPDIVWFGEVPYHMEAIEEALSECELFISIGTSGQVFPAAGFVMMAQDNGARCVECNLEKTSSSSLFSEGYYGPAGLKVPEYVKSLV